MKQQQDFLKNKGAEMKLAAILLGLWFFVLLIWVQVEQTKDSQPYTEQQVQAMQMEVRARSLARYGEYEEQAMQLEQMTKKELIAIINKQKRMLIEQTNFYMKKIKEHENGIERN